MTTILFSLCWLGEPWRIERNLKWLEFNRKLKTELGYDKIVFVDNASTFSDLALLKGDVYNSNFELLQQGGSDLDIYRFEEHIPRTGIWEYPYCWRGVDFLKQIITHYKADKVIGLDTDFYILTPKLADYVRNLDAGWTSFFNHKYGFPEAAIHVLCKDSIDRLMNFPIPSYTHYNNQHMEWLLPFTQVLKTEFTGDRYGETVTQQTPEMDYYGQWQPGVDLIFRKTT